MSTGKRGGEYKGDPGGARAEHSGVYSKCTKT